MMLAVRVFHAYLFALDYKLAIGQKEGVGLPCDFVKVYCATKGVFCVFKPDTRNPSLSLCYLEISQTIIS